MKNNLILGLATIALGMFVCIAPAMASITAEDETCYVAGDCDKCGKKDCKGCDAKAEGKGEGKGEAKSCAKPEGGKACCSHGDAGKKEGKAEEKPADKKK